MNRKKLFKRILYLILFIFIVNFLANKFYWYSSIWYFDMIMHFLGGFWLGLVFLYFFSHKFSPHSFNFFLKLIIFVLFVGIGWEIFELLVDKTITQNSFNILDTSSDIFFDLTGGLISIYYFTKKIMFSSKNQVE